MKNTNLFTTKLFRVSALAVSASMLLTSCVIYTGGYSETDGVYYDPNKDTLPKGYSGYAENRVGEHYDFQKEKGIIERNKDNIKEAESRFRNPKYSAQNTESDWGNYAGTQVNYYNFNNYSPYWGYTPYYSSWNSWGHPWGWGSGFNLGWNNWSGWNFGFNWGWGSSWYSGYHYSPWRYGYGFYDPFFYGAGYYYPYYGRSYNYYPRRASGPNRVMPNTNVYGGGMRTDNGYRQPNVRSNGNMRTPAYQQNRSYSYPQDNGYRPQNNYPNMRQGSDGGFRGNFGGGFRTGGGFGGGSVGGGSMRTGGGMRTNGR